MTGSILVAIITPLVALPALGLWLIMIFWADAHPTWKTRIAPEGPELTAAGFIPAQPEPGELEGSEPAPSSGRQVA
jgi:hypothetical protein